MPYPILLGVAAAAAAAGTGLQMAGQAKARSAMNDAQMAELLRQRGFQKEASQIAQASIKKAAPDNAQDTLDTAAANRAREYANLDRVPVGSSAPIGRPANEVVSAPAGRFTRGVKAAGNAWTQLVGKAQSKLGSYNDWGLQQGIDNQRAGQDLQRIGGNARASANVLPIEMDAASHRGDALQGWGQLVSALGSVAGLYAATAPAAGASAASQAAAAEAAASGYAPVGSLATRIAQPNWAAIGAVP